MVKEFILENLIEENDLGCAPYTGELKKVTKIIKSTGIDIIDIQHYECDALWYTKVMYETDDGEGKEQKYCYG